MVQDEQTRQPINDFERDLVLPPDEMLRQKRNKLLAEVEGTAKSLERQRRELDRLEERDRLLRAALADLDAALERMHLKPMRIAAADH